VAAAGRALRRKSPVQGDPSTTPPIRSAALRMTGTAGGTVPAYQEIMHNHVTTYAGS